MKCLVQWLIIVVGASTLLLQYSQHAQDEYNFLVDVYEVMLFILAKGRKHY
jgi:hypothetical protein